MAVTVVEYEEFVREKGCPRCSTNGWIYHQQGGYICVACLDLCLEVVESNDPFEDAVVLYCQMTLTDDSRGN